MTSVNKQHSVFPLKLKICMGGSSSPKLSDAAKKATPWHLLCRLVIKPSQQQA